jgi:malonate transporter and related proteins
MASAFELVLSIFLIVALGGVLGRTRLFGPEIVTALNNFVWHVAIPAYMFRTMANNALPGPGELGLVALYYATALCIYGVLGFSMGKMFALKPGERPAIAMSGCFANGMMLGAPIVAGAFGDRALHLLFILIAFHSPIFVTVSTIWMEIERGEKISVLGTLGRTGASLLRQTPLVALGLGILTSALGIKVTGQVDWILATLGAAMIPLGLFAVGASLSRVEVKGDLPQASIAMLTKLVILPAAMLLTTRLAGVPPLWSAVATLMASLPTGLVAFNFAAANKLAPRRIATEFFLANVGAVVTLALWVGFLQQSQ